MATNSGLAILFGSITPTLGNTICAEEVTFRHWFTVPFLRAVSHATNWGAGRSAP